jgi:hypothetical protein
VDKDNAPFRGSTLNVSEDGSHILMVEHGDASPGDPAYQCSPQTPGCLPKVQKGLYLRVDDEHTYEIAPGHEVQYVGSTADGATVYLTSTEQLTTDDNDTSSDLFVWEQSSPDSLTRVSGGTSGAGNSDSCLVSWVEKCGVQAISVEALGERGSVGNGQSDLPIALDSGDIYFESPEQLDGAKGNFEQVNLYVYRHGNVQFVAALKAEPYCPERCSVNPVGRIQVTRDGGRAAFVTVSKLTSYENAGRSEMYTFTPANHRIVCVSCLPDGQAPTSEVLASQNGLFMTEDGRTFFSTGDALVPRDTNENEDVYEYAEGRAQLISTGLGFVNAKVSLANLHNRPGLVGVSANGTDVYFGTTDVLVSQDHNGSEFKIYDARTGGGFPAEASVLKCEAADECHGPVGGPPGSPSDRTSANLGKPVKRHTAHKKKRGKKHVKKAKAKKRRHRAAQGRHHRG